MSDRRSDDNKVICPACNNEFSAIPVAVQEEIESLRKRVNELDIAWHKENDEVCRLEVELKELEEFNLIHKDENKLLREELAALKQSQGEPVGEVVMFNGFKDIRYNVKDVEVGDKLYTSAPTIPEGWQIVPIEPTDEMFIAGDKFMECTSSLGEAWESMLAAAPKPEDVK